jgi:hypothetical protein
MDEREAHDEFVKAYNRLCVAQGCPSVKIPEYAKVSLHKVEGETIGPSHDYMLRVEFMAFVTEKDIREHPKKADFDSTAEEIVDAEVLPAPPKQIAQSSSDV